VGSIPTFGMTFGMTFGTAWGCSPPLKAGYSCVTATGLQSAIEEEE
jgi:hypothetical protein